MRTREPPRFTARWLRFDPHQPTRTRLAMRFVAAVAGLLIACALLVALAG